VAASGAGLWSVVRGRVCCRFPALRFKGVGADPDLTQGCSEYPAPWGGDFY
jgi:hypothetical protein